MKDVQIGDEVLCYSSRLYARVEEVFPAAVCVRLIAFERSWHGLRLSSTPYLWRADEIENLSVCRHCGIRTDIRTVAHAGVPFRICGPCASIQHDYSVDQLSEHVPH